MALGHLLHGGDRQAGARQPVGGAGRGEEGEAQPVQLAGDLEHRALVEIVDRDQHGARQRQGRAGGGLGLGKSMAEAGGMAHDLAGGLHLGAKPVVGPGKLLEGQHGFLHKEALHRRHLGKAQLFQAAAGHHLRRQPRNRHAGGLADKGHGARSARVDLQHVNDVVLDGILHVHQAAHAQRQPQALGVVAHDAEVVQADFVGRQHAGAVARVHAGLLDVLHDAGDHHALAVGQGIDVHLVSVFQKVVDQHRPVGRGRGGLRQEGGQGGVVVGDLHGAAAEHVGRPHQHREADAVGHTARGLHRLRRAPLGVRHLQLAQQLAKAHPVLGQVNRIRAGAPDGHTRRRQPPRQVDGRLPAKLHDHAFRLLGFDDVEHVFKGQRLKVQPVGRVVVGAHGLGIAVDHDGLEAQFLEREAGLHAAIVELNALADAVRPAAQDDHLAPVGWLGFVAGLVGGIKIGRVRLELSRASVHAVVAGLQPGGEAMLPHLQRAGAAGGTRLQVGRDLFIRDALALGAPQPLNG